MPTLSSNYYKDMFGTAAMRDVFSDDRRFLTWLETEAALAKVQANLGLIPESAATSISAAARLENLDVPSMKEAYEKIGFPILPLVKQLATACDPESAKFVHWGATTHLQLIDKQPIGPLADLADWLRHNSRNQFLLTAPPLRLTGAVGSPVTPIATV